MAPTSLNQAVSAEICFPRGLRPNNHFVKTNFIDPGTLELLISIYNTACVKHQRLFILMHQAAP